LATSKRIAKVTMLLELCGEPEEVAFGTVIATVSDINSRHSERNIYSKTSVGEFNSTLLFMPRRVARKFGAVRFCNVLVVSQELDKVFEHTSLIELTKPFGNNKPLEHRL